MCSWTCLGESKPRRRRKKNTGEGVSGARKRKLSAEQVNFLEMNFGDEHKLETERKDKLASDLGLDPRQVAVWFQNRRARWKNKKLEEEYTKLKTAHESIVVQKCQLESEVNLSLVSLCMFKNMSLSTLLVYQGSVVWIIPFLLLHQRKKFSIANCLIKCYILLFY
jgi:hypothetical protein